ncbi:MAG: DUF3387 domain-containing protein [Verrucomicrobia bacterium]|nr:DUF3387 domain-containing protein [Verrucomicrobiota bacterium]
MTPLLSHFMNGIIYRRFLGLLRRRSHDSIAKLKDLIRNDSPDLVMAMIQKFQERDLQEMFPQLNSSPKILLMIDEAHRTQYNLDRLRLLETAVVISGSHNDESHINAFTGEDYHKRAVRRFKLPFNTEEKEGEETFDGRVGMVIVNNMLVTGFDAPLEQVLYLDKVVTDHNLLQTIARVNRVGDEHKDKGFVVDYVGIGHHIKKALSAYDEREQQEILDALCDPTKDLNELIEAHRKIWSLLKKHGLTDFNDPDASIDLFYNEDIRFEYILAFKELTRAFNLVLPRKEALDYFKDYQSFCEINALACKHLKDQRLSMKGIPPKLRAITDAFLKSKGVAQKIAPISILDADFQKDVKARKRSKTKAAEVEHAIRHFIDLNLDEDPELFASFAAELERILQEFRDNWDLIYTELEKLRQKILAKEKEQTYGLDRKKQMPVFADAREWLKMNGSLLETDF